MSIRAALTRPLELFSGQASAFLAVKHVDCSLWGAAKRHMLSGLTGGWG